MSLRSLLAWHEFMVCIRCDKTWNQAHDARIEDSIQGRKVGRQTSSKNIITNLQRAKLSSETESDSVEEGL